METSDFYLVKVEIENDSCSDIHFTAEMNNYFWLNSDYTSEDLRVGIVNAIKNLRKALKIIPEWHMIDISLIKSSTAYGAKDEGIELYRALHQWRYDADYTVSLWDGNRYDFDHSPKHEMSDISEISRIVRRLMTKASALYKKNKMA